MFGREDLDFLERCFQKLLINFTGGLTERTRADLMFSKVVSWVLTTLVPSTVPSLCPREVHCVRPMVLLVASMAFMPSTC